MPAASTSPQRTCTVLVCSTLTRCPVAAGRRRAPRRRAAITALPADARCSAGACRWPCVAARPPRGSAAAAGAPAAARPDARPALRPGPGRQPGSRGTTKATGFTRPPSSAMPTTPASATPGCASSAASTSVGVTHIAGHLEPIVLAAGVVIEPVAVAGQHVAGAKPFADEGPAADVEPVPVRRPARRRRADVEHTGLAVGDRRGRSASSRRTSVPGTGVPAEPGRLLPGTSWPAP